MTLLGVLGSGGDSNYGSGSDIMIIMVVAIIIIIIIIIIVIIIIICISFQLLFSPVWMMFYSRFMV